MHQVFPFTHHFICSYTMMLFFFLAVIDISNTPSPPKQQKITLSATKPVTQTTEHLTTYTPSATVTPQIQQQILQQQSLTTSTEQQQLTTQPHQSTISLAQSLLASTLVQPTTKTVTVHHSKLGLVQQTLPGTVVQMQQTKTKPVIIQPNISQSVVVQQPHRVVTAASQAAVPVSGILGATISLSTQQPTQTITVAGSDRLITQQGTSHTVIPAADTQRQVQLSMYNV